MSLKLIDCLLCLDVKSKIFCKLIFSLLCTLIVCQNLIQSIVENVSIPSPSVQVYIKKKKETLLSWEDQKELHLYTILGWREEKFIRPPLPPRPEPSDLHFGSTESLLLRLCCIYKHCQSPKTTYLFPFITLFLNLKEWICRVMNKFRISLEHSTETKLNKS